MLNNGREKVSARINACRTVFLCTYHHTFCLLRDAEWNSKMHPKISENFEMSDAFLNSLPPGSPRGPT